MSEVKQAGEELAAGVEVAVEQLINEKADVITGLLLDSVAKAIPGQIDDMVIAAAKPVVQPLIKKQLLDLAEKISAKV